MLRNKPQNCPRCNKKPKLKRRLIALPSCYYKYYTCCDIQTFSTREEEFCRELWNCRVDKENLNKKLNKTFNKDGDDE